VRLAGYGDLYEDKIKGFAIFETSFIIFLVMASRRLDADPFLNELYNERSYTKAGLDWIENDNEFKDVLVIFRYASDCGRYHPPPAY
jgi:alpha-dioxygenase